jgi:cyclopropane-fatty-acyl-phospholipid synthase
MSSAEEFVKGTLKKADISINGSKKGDIKVNNKKFYSRLISGGTLALGESYMDGCWDCDDLDIFFYKILSANLDKEVKITPYKIWLFIKSFLINQQSKAKSHVVGEKHYDIGNFLYSKMLDPLMNYSCGYWKNAKTLEQSQKEKLDLICKKLHLKKGMKVLDIGCGWGGFAYFAAKNYGVEVTGVTISKEQAMYARKKCKNLPVKILLQDYRDLKGNYDAIVSIGMFEHVGYKNYKTFMKVANRCLKKNGLFLLHSIASNLSGKIGDPWLNKYIFPRGMLPSAKQITNAYEGIFMLEDWHNFGPYYDHTLMAWHKKFNMHWDEIKKHGYDERFKRMWNYYLLCCAGSFRAHRNQLWQIVFSKVESQVKHTSIR